MIGLLFLGAAILWLLAVYHVAKSAPRWLHVKRHVRLTRAVVAIALLVGPFLDQIVGMRQFDTLCKERAVVTVTPEARQVKRAKELPLRRFELSGYWVPIVVWQATYLDADSGKEFAHFEVLHTKGGRVARLMLLGGDYSCSPPSPNALNEIDIDRLVKEGGAHRL